MEAPIVRLPDKIRKNIMQYLPQNSILAIRKTCRKLYWGKDLNKAPEGAHKRPCPDNTPEPSHKKPKRRPGRRVKNPGDGKDKYRANANEATKAKNRKEDEEIEALEKLIPRRRMECEARKLVHLQLRQEATNLTNLLENVRMMNPTLGSPPPARERLRQLQDGGPIWQWGWHADVAKWEWFRIQYPLATPFEQWESDKGFQQQWPQLFGLPAPNPTQQDLNRKYLLPLRDLWHWGFNENVCRWEWYRTHYDHFGPSFVQWESDTTFTTRCDWFFKVAPHVATLADKQRGKHLFTFEREYWTWGWNPNAGHSGRFEWYFQHVKQGYAPVKQWESDQDFFERHLWVHRLPGQ
ncbi:uncharacterized protein BDZ99DRAFT_547229 [Mytilinidion resinicola]|uniref:F-box domain-containing protein n=1 Tax=Mytilinidion resinicola TaxID=574789 RepID=A0A6A6Y3A8_9PEZI|nr:uncharacterized protein BDZ99DRAFT_547229 [Mytilinidion resinicola]KAF2803311.1 hypothetical protein BDZ99DRAFT_547229 [Mytilinidion resinicola]